MKITIDLYKIGYFVGKWCTRATLTSAAVKRSIAGIKNVDKVAKAHRIVSSDPETVTSNLFDCLQYIN